MVIKHDDKLFLKMQIQTGGNLKQEMSVTPRFIYFGEWHYFQSSRIVATHTNIVHDATAIFVLV